MATIEESVRIVGAAWKESPYYENAERWTHIFWDCSTSFRRLFDHLDLSVTLELACGHGRHSEKIAPQCGRLVLMDIHQDNVDFCRSRLNCFPHVEYHVNNGFNFQPLADQSLTSLFCYDAMVHFSPDIVRSYLLDTARVLKPKGRALFHHSNYPAPENVSYGKNPHARNHMTQALFTRLAHEAHLTILDSIVIPWSNEPDLDCITLVERAVATERKNRGPSPWRDGPRVSQMTGTPTAPRFCAPVFYS